MVTRTAKTKQLLEEVLGVEFKKSETGVWVCLDKDGEIAHGKTLSDCVRKTELAVGGVDDN